MFSLIPWKKRSSDMKVAHDRDDWQLSLSRFRDEFESLWDRFLGDWDRELSLWGDDRQIGFSGGLEDKENEYLFHANLPGFEPNEIDVNVTGNTLQVKAEHKQEKQGKNGGSSYRYGSFQRYFTLPQGVDSQKIDAKYHSGVLEVHLPKTEEAKGKRIAVNAS